MKVTSTCKNSFSALLFVTALVGCGGGGGGDGDGVGNEGVVSVAGMGISESDSGVDDGGGVGDGGSVGDGGAVSDGGGVDDGGGVGDTGMGIAGSDLQGMWRTACVADEDNTSFELEFALNGNSFVSSQITYINSTNCSVSDFFTVALNGTLATIGERNASVDAINLDLLFANVRITGSDGFNATLASQGTTLQDVFSADGITDINNVPVTTFVSSPAFFTIYSVSGNTLRFGDDTDSFNGTSPALRHVALSTEDVYTRVGAVTQTDSMTQGEGETEVPEFTGPEVTFPEIPVSSVRSIESLLGTVTFNYGFAGDADRFEHSVTFTSANFVQDDTFGTTLETEIETAQGTLAFNCLFDDSPGNPLPYLCTNLISNPDSPFQIFSDNFLFNLTGDLTQGSGSYNFCIYDSLSTELATEVSDCVTELLNFPDGDTLVQVDRDGLTAVAFASRGGLLHSGDNSFSDAVNYKIVNNQANGAAEGDQQSPDMQKVVDAIISKLQSR